MENIEKIKEYIFMLSPELQEDNIDFYIGEIIDRVLIYTKRKELPIELERIIARMYVDKIKFETEKAKIEHGDILSISDNGQSLSFKGKNESLNANRFDIIDNYSNILDRFINRKVKVFGEK